MPAIVQDPRILAAAQKAIDVLLRFKGITIVLTPVKGAPVAKPGGGHDFVPPPPRAPQLLALSKTSGFDGIEFSPSDDGENRKRAYVLTGRWDAEIGIGDQWEDDEAEYTVNTVDQSSGFKTQATVTGWLKVAP
jgi:hypothetical protein